jgi:hypothetical protein
MGLRFSKATLLTEPELKRGFTGDLRTYRQGASFGSLAAGGGSFAVQQP